MPAHFSDSVLYPRHLMELRTARCPLILHLTQAVSLLVRFLPVLVGKLLRHLSHQIEAKQLTNGEEEILLKIAVLSDQHR